jgi:tetratricopeptide (TPR) repeat protein
VKPPDRDISDYRKGLRYSEEACQLEPRHGLYLNTLGVAHYRVGNYEKALEVLLRADAINQKQFQGSIPRDLTFLAMTQHRLGHAQEAQTYLQRLRERMKDPHWAPNAEFQHVEAQGLLREAEALLARPTTPGSK